MYFLIQYVTKNPMQKFITIILLLLICTMISAQTKNIVVAHRGAWKTNNLPENSIAALNHAVDLKCIASEFDVWMTADNVCVVNHDPKYHGLDIEKVAYSALVNKHLKNGESIPTLESYLIAGTQQNFAIRLVLEIKPSQISKERGRLVAKEVMKIVERLQVQKYVDYISFDIGILETLISINPKIHTQYLNGDLSPGALYEKGISGINYNYKVYYKNPHWIAEAKKLNLTLNAWTVNKTKDLDFFIKQDFDLITTNEPELLMRRVDKYYKSKWKLVFNDEFEYEGLPDTKLWNYDVGGHGWGNNEQQYYLANSLSNSFVKDGHLHIRALKKDFENSNYTSAKLTTYQRFLFQYGKVEVKAKLPEGKGTWPAIWMLPETIKTQKEGWPLCGEIDIMEHIGKDPNIIHVSLHSEKYNHMKGTQITFFDSVPDVSGTFHTYGIEWDEIAIKFFIDEKLYFKVNKGQGGRDASKVGWPYDKQYFLILNLAIGGNWGGEIDPTIFPAEMVIDYVRVYQNNQKQIDL